MFLLDGRVVTSASDLTNASKCEFAFLRALDARLGRIEAVHDDPDAMLERTARLGDKHEDRVHDAYRQRFGAGVVDVARPPSLTSQTLRHATDATLAAFSAGADVVFQATFFDGSFVGFADFIVRRPGGVYLVQDTKLARRARVTALLQLAAYADQLDAMGVPRADTVELLLGDGSVSEHRVDDILPVYRKRRARLLSIIDERIADTAPVAWGDPRYTVCGRCETCAREVDAARDVLLVAGLRISQRDALRAAGIRTIDELAASAEEVDGLLGSTVENLRAQARLQVLAEDALATAASDEHPPPPFELRDASALAAIPAPDDGDLFFDFEGDPLYTEGAARTWGLDYLFGVLDTRERFTAIWAHSFAEEATALLAFLDLVEQRRAAHPGLHIYHYASYERTHLTSIAARHGVGEARVDQLLADGVLVDLYPIVRRAVRVGSRSYSIKKLEPLYMGDEERAGVTNAADSIVEYVRARELADTGASDPTTGLSGTAARDRIFADIADYNRYDVLSTLRLRDWLRTLAAEAGVVPAPPPPDGKAYAASPLAVELADLAGPRDASGAPRDADRTALALASAAIDYHQREVKSFWWGHYFRLEQPVEEWEDTRDVLVVDPARSIVSRDWEKPDGKIVERRETVLRGRFGPGSRLSEGGSMFALYEPDAGVVDERSTPGHRVTRTVTVLEVLDDGVRVLETRPKTSGRHDRLPVALAPGSPPPAKAQQDAIAQWAEHIVRTRPGWPRDPMVDILRRQPPRTGRGELAPVIGEGYETAVVASLLDLDDSYIAVQGPPGTGKTHLASHVIARLVRDHGWKVGVVAQSHAVVENVLDAILANTGLDPDLVAKAAKDGDETEHGYRVLASKDDLLLFGIDHAATGYVIGGTAWDFANPARVPRRSLDLLVVDEAGQFSLAATIATSVAARNLLLLGDPQQLPQVSQGTHPEPIDLSALGWVADGHDVLPGDLGYFLAESRRMHPAVAAPVSRLSYAGALRSHPSAADRRLDEVPAGLHPVPVVHAGNSTESPEEADHVAAIARSVVGHAWHASADAAARPLEARDVIVVTPYNAQSALVRETLDRAGLTAVRVGTVDKFQGQEAVIAIVSLAASSAADVPRGMEFLIMKNRLNVAISRAQWAAFLVHSPELTDHLPITPQGVTELSAFIRLVE